MNTLTDDNFELVAARHYKSIGDISYESFKKDLFRVMVIRRAITRYQNTDKLNVKLMLNHTIILYNVFGTFVSDILIFKIPGEHHPYIVPILRYLNLMPDIVQGVDTRSISEHPVVAMELSKL